MKKLVSLAIVLGCSVTASAEPMVLRAQANEYALVGEGTVLTKDCTVTAEGTLTARLARHGRKTWVVFLDRDGQEEAQCEVKVTLTRPHPLRERTLLAVSK